MASTSPCMFTGAGLLPPSSLNNLSGGNPSFPPSRQPTPAPSHPATSRQAADPPDGVPQAKRPLNRETIQVAQSGMRVMTVEDLSAAFFQLNAHAEKEEGLAASVHSCVDHNAQLLTQACERLFKLEATSTTADAVQATLVLKLTAETREALEHVHAQDMSRDANLREEIDGMTAKVSAGYDELSHRLDALQRELAAVGRPADGSPPDQPLGVTGLPRSPPGFDPAAPGEQFREVTEVTSSLAARVHEAESKLGTYERAINDAQSKIDQLHLRGADPMASRTRLWCVKISCPRPC